MPHFTLLSSSTLLRLAFALLSLFCITTFPTTHAQSKNGKFQPTVSDGTWSSFVEGMGLYVLGASTGSQGDRTQAFMIDLSTSWSASKPAYKKLPDLPTGPKQGTIVPGAIAADNQTWAIPFVDGVQTFNITTSKWQRSSKFNFKVNSNYSISVAGPSRDIIYVPNGVIGGSGLPELLRLDMNTNKYTTAPMAPDLQQSMGFSAAWSDSKRKMVVVGGTADKQFVYNDIFNWMPLVADGDRPTQRSYPCLVPFDGGNKMILFGGNSLDLTTSFRDIYILELKDSNTASTWTSGPEAPESRTSLACAVSNGYFIAWGGLTIKNDNTQPASTMQYAGNTPLIYDINNQTWVSQYIAPVVQPNVTTTPSPTFTSLAPNATSTVSNTTITPTTSEFISPTTTAFTPHPTIIPTSSADLSRSTSSSGITKHLPLILGLVSGAIVLVVAAQAFVLYRSHKRRKAEKGDPYSKKLALLKGIPSSDFPPSGPSPSTVHHTRHSPTVSDSYRSSPGVMSPMLTERSNMYNPNYQPRSLTSEAYYSNTGYISPPPPAASRNEMRQSSRHRLHRSDDDFFSHQGDPSWQSNYDTSRQHSVFKDRSRGAVPSSWGGSQYSRSHSRYEPPGGMRRGMQDGGDYNRFPQDPYMSFPKESMKERRNVQAGDFGSHRASQHPHAIEGYRSEESFSQGRYMDMDDSATVINDDYFDD
ncbi:hypothetical protein BC939DRAFT_84089 [Gamsiella multidivaricata]|uniref:uncharacterized protein n=1 Tax=Gamsiella multidivaricata TaxID=101098 RepID=UPI00221EB28E|nr:uncharacterized protein BC939DRAFT_84089 [Gamsiella multidivaricata]KAG0367000.1 hypothetical protein BGZ54_004565 [Gamsiella multidivaricata]KAI7827555.1 hypothetical protein BC939DRAFT_84089 [Gamsiella multidivaricata]